MSRSLGALTLDLIARTGGFEQGMDKAARVADKKTREIERQAKARAKAIEASFAKLAIGITAAWSTLNLVGAVKGAADLADQLSKLSQRTGVAVEDLSALNYAAKLNDATLQDLGNGLKGLSNKMLAAQSGSTEAAAAFKALNIQFEAAPGKLRPVEAVLFDVADAFSKMEDGAGKSAIANKLMEESGLRLIPTLNNGRAGLEAMRNEAEALGGIMGDELARASVELNDNLARMDTIAQGLAASIGNAVIPAINEMAVEFLNARRAGMSFLEALVGIGLSDPTKSASEHIARLTEEIETLENGKWFEKSLFGNLSKDKTLEQKRKELEYWRLQLLEGGSADPRDRAAVAAPRIAAPALPATPKSPKAATAKTSSSSDDHPMADAARAYGAALESLNRSLLAANTSGMDLTATQTELMRVMTDPTFYEMPETWRVTVAQQAEFVIAGERAAAEQARLNALLEATPTAQLEHQRQNMQLLAEALERGRISAQQFGEAATAALGNPEPVAALKEGFLDLSTVANDAARNMADVFTDFFTGTNDDIGDMLKNFLTATAKMIAQTLMLQAIQGGMAALGIPGFAKGGVFDGGLQAFAQGGVVDSPTLFKFASGGSFKSGLMGEAGPEAILPLKRGSDGKLGVTMNGGAGDTHITINVTTTGDRNESSTGEQQTASRQLAKQIEGAVMGVLMREIRPGGMLYE